MLRGFETEVNSKFEEIKLYRHSHRYFRLVLNKPKKKNAISEKMIDELLHASHLIDTDPNCKVVKLEAEGDVFCAGGDLGWMREQVSYSRTKRIEAAKKLATMFKKMNSISKPLIGVIRGDAYGGGLGFISICDYCICSSKVKFGLTETRLGLIPATISPYLVAKIGESNSRNIFLSGEIFNANKANKIGLINEVVEPSEINDSLKSYMTFFDNTSAQAVSASKALIDYLRPNITNEVIDETAVRLANTWESEDANKGLIGFLNKEKITW